MQLILFIFLIAFCPVWEKQQLNKYDKAAIHLTDNCSIYTIKSCHGNWLYARMSDLASRVTIALGGENASVEPAESLEASRTCTVKQGDTLWAIARKYLGKGGRYKEIVSLNGLKSNAIYGGMKLKILDR